MRSQINLVDPGLLPEVQHLSGKRVLLVVSCALALLTAHYSYERVQLSKTMALSTKNDASVDPLLTGATTSSDLALLQTQLMRDELLREGLSKLTDLPVGNADMLASVIDALPDSLWLKELEFVGKRGVRIRGGTTNPAGLTEFSAKLSKVAALGGLPVQVVSLAPELENQADAPLDAASAPAKPPELNRFAFELATVQDQTGTP